jgi:predicted ATPase
MLAPLDTLARRFVPRAGDRFYVITGGPGSGKSALIEALAADGFSTMPEACRAIIQDQVEIGGHALAWQDRRSFAELMLNWEMRSYRAALVLNGPVIFDCGVPDVLECLRLERPARSLACRPRGATIPLSQASFCRSALGRNLRA